MDLIYRILLELSAVFAIYWIMKTKKLLPSIISSALIIGIIVALYPSLQNQFNDFYVYMASCLLAIIYGIYMLSRNRFGAYIIVLMSGGVFLYWLWVINHWHGNALVGPAITLIAGAVGLIGRAKLRNELGFLVILAMDAGLLLLEAWMKR
ncbi:MAG: hypothetical protein GQ527_02245 [Bacteroidales bacterium]|nr:hypothetical protein [Bacteroidales bacterium]